MSSIVPDGLSFLRGLAWLAVGLAGLFVAAVAFARAQAEPMRAAFWLWIAVVAVGVIAVAPARYWWPMLAGRDR